MSNSDETLISRDDPKKQFKTTGQNNKKPRNTEDIQKKPKDIDQSHEPKFEEKQKETATIHKKKQQTFGQATGTTWQNLNLGMPAKKEIKEAEKPNAEEKSVKTPQPVKEDQEKPKVEEKKTDFVAAPKSEEKKPKATVLRMPAEYSVINPQYSEFGYFSKPIGEKKFVVNPEPVEASKEEPKQVNPAVEIKREEPKPAVEEKKPEAVPEPQPVQQPAMPQMQHVQPQQQFQFGQGFSQQMPPNEFNQGFQSAIPPPQQPYGQINQNDPEFQLFQQFQQFRQFMMFTQYNQARQQQQPSQQMPQQQYGGYQYQQSQVHQGNFYPPPPPYSQ